LKKLVGYITASLPNNNFTVDLALSMKDSGLDILELGMPFSDPIADGGIIEEANVKALEKGYKLENLFSISQEIGSKIDTFWMGYSNPFYNKGFEYFLKKSKDYGIKGFLIPDLSYEESKKNIELFDLYNRSLINFIAPNSTKNRIKTLVSNAKDFIYLVSYTGITGVNKNQDLSLVIENIKSYTKVPLYIGFGVDEKTAYEKAKGVDGVIVGSAFVKYLLDDSLSFNEKISKISKISKNIKDQINS
jgi:tryptophan synthase alpha chain